MCVCGGGGPVSGVCNEHVRVIIIDNDALCFVYVICFEN